MQTACVRHASVPRTVCVCARLCVRARLCVKYGQMEQDTGQVFVHFFMILMNNILIDRTPQDHKLKSVFYLKLVTLYVVIPTLLPITELLLAVVLLTNSETFNAV